jgi:hypothetical protein
LTIGTTFIIGTFSKSPRILNYNSDTFFNFEIQKSLPRRDIVLTVRSTPLYQIGQGVFRTDIQVLLFDQVDKHTPPPKIEEDIEFLKVLNVEQFLEKSWKLIT